MKKQFYIFLLISSIITTLNAKNYVLDLVIDKNSYNYLEKIKDETKTLFNLEDNIEYKIHKCNSTDCFIDKKAVYLIQSKIKKDKKKDSYIVAYNDAFTKIDKQKIVRATALSIFEFLKDKKSSTIYIQNKEKENSFIVKKKLDSLTLDDVFDKLNKNNFSIKQNANRILMGTLDIESAKSDYKPHLELFSNVIQIDADRAKYSTGQYSEGTIEMGAKVSQLIYSNDVLKNIEIKKLLDKSIKNETKAANDEILYQAVLTYLNIMKAKKNLNIIKTKQMFIKQNLDFAKQRFEIGAKDKTDIYRWESELADVNMQLTSAKNSYDSLKTELSNIILYEKEYELEEYTLDSKRFKLLQKDAVKTIVSPKIQELLSEQIIFSHPNLKYIKELIEVKKEEKSLNESSRYMPTLALEAEAKKIIDRYGEAENYARPWDDKEYQAVLNLSIPLYEGGEKSVAIQKNELELINLKLQYEDAKSIINKNIKQNSDSLKSSYENLYYAKESLKFTKKNYESVLDRYKKGEENIITLLDAQNTFIVSRLNENISEIEYLTNLSSIYFFSGNIDVLINEIKKEKFEKNILKAINE